MIYISERTKKILMVVGFITFSIAVAVALYFAFFKADVPEEIIINDVVTDTGGLIGADTGLVGTIEDSIPPTGLRPSTIAAGGLTQVTTLTAGSIGSPNLSTTGDSMNYYDPADDRFYMIDPDGNVVQLSDQKFPDVDNVSWAEQGDKAVIEFPDGSNVIYNFETETQVTLPTHWEDFDFSPAGDEIIAKSLAIDPENRWLVITSDDGTRTTSVAELGNNDDKVQVNWSPSDQVVAFSDTGPLTSGFGRATILAIGKNQENFPGLVVEGVNFEAVWTPRGDQVLYSVAGEINNYKPLLWVAGGSGDDIGSSRRSLGIETWVDKCTFSGVSTVICAVPQYLPNNSGIQPTIAEDTYDYLYEIDINTGFSALLAIPEEQQQIENLSVSEDGSNIFFTDEFGVLQMIRLD
jgi:hypothetical protein